jgi:hypothetical protein
MLRSGEDGRGGRINAIAQPPPSPASGSHGQAIKTQAGRASSKNNPSDGNAAASIGASCSNRDCDLNGDGDNSEEIEDENEELSDDEDEGTEGYKKGMVAIKDD